MSAILDAIFPKRRKGAQAAPLASAEIEAEIERRRADLGAARARIEAAAAKRNTAVEALDAAGIVAADADATMARAEAEVAEKAVAALAAAHAERIEAERREAFHARVESARQAGFALTERIAAEYNHHAAALAGLLADLSDYSDSVEVLTNHARGLGETVDLPNPEIGRLPPRRWRARWRLPDGSASWDDAKNAPRGTVRWIDNEPVPARDDVTVEPWTHGATVPLLAAIQSLPGFGYGEAAHWPRPAPQPEIRVAPGRVDTSRPPRFYRPEPALVPDHHDDSRLERL